MEVAIFNNETHYGSLPTPERIARVATDVLKNVAPGTRSIPTIEAKRRLAVINALSTLGYGAVAMLIDQTEIVADWPPDEIERLRRFAWWRTAGIRQVHNLFPALFAGAQPIGHFEEPVSTPDEIPQELLAETCEHHHGVLPVLVTAPHGGRLKTVQEHQLKPNPFSTKPDGATADIARDIGSAILSVSPQTPLPALIDLIRREYRTPQTCAYFETQTFLRLCAIRSQLLANESLLHLDIHGFKPNTNTDAYDLILGTGHRTCMGGLDTDKELAEFMSNHDYSVYLPSEEVQPGEHFTADSPSTLAQRVRALGLPQTGSIQIEIHRKFRIGGDETYRTKSKLLAQHLGAFCVEWGLKNLRP